MAKIEDLVAQIADERLRKAIGAEVREFKKNKKFGLVLINPILYSRPAECPLYSESD